MAREIRGSIPALSWSIGKDTVATSTAFIKKGEEHDKIKESIIIETTKLIAFKEDEINMLPFDFIVCSKFEFVIKLDEEIEVRIVEFKSNDDRKSYYLEKVKLKFGGYLQYSAQSN